MLVQCLILGIYLFIAATSEDLEIEKAEASNCQLGEKVSVLLSNTADEIAFHGVLSFGTPPQYFDTLFDTGTSNILLPSVNCFSWTCAMHNGYDSQASTSYEPNGTNVTIPYQIGNFSGILSSDTVQIGKYAVKHQTFTEITTPPYVYPDAVFDCVLGLGRSPFGDYGVQALLDNMKGQGLIKQRLFSLFFNGRRRQLTFGHSHFKRHAGEMIHLPVANKTSDKWQIRMDGILFGGHKFGKDSIANVDTGSAYVYGPMKEIAALHKIIAGKCYENGQFQVACDASSHYKPQFVLGGATFTWNDYVVENHQKGKETICITGFVGTDQPTWTLGSIFLEEVYTQFDMDQDTVGFANLLPGKNPVQGEVEEIGLEVDGVDI